MNDERYPELANSFLCKAMIDEALGDLVEATWAFIQAAWVCDDDRKREQAAECRRRAIEMFERAEKSGLHVYEPVFGTEGASTIVLVDLLRRTGQMERAQQVIETRKHDIAEEEVRRILEYQSLLIRAGDTSCHTMEEVSDMEGAPGTLESPS